MSKESLGDDACPVLCIVFFGDPVVCKLLNLRKNLAAFPEIKLLILGVYNFEF